jgi:hypothetical protein
MRPRCAPASGWSATQLAASSAAGIIAARTSTARLEEELWGRSATVQLARVTLTALALNTGHAYGSAFRVHLV